MGLVDIAIVAPNLKAQHDTCGGFIEHQQVTCTVYIVARPCRCSLAPNKSLVGLFSPEQVACWIFFAQQASFMRLAKTDEARLNTN
jgi:hypothetical protein